MNNTKKIVVFSRSAEIVELAEKYRTKMISLYEKFLEDDDETYRIAGAKLIDSFNKKTVEELIISSFSRQLFLENFRGENNDN